MNAGADAPWDGGAQKQAASASNFKLLPDNQLPEIYRPDTSDFSASAGRTVTQPDRAPRKPEPTVNKLFIGVGISELVGIGLAVFGFVVMPAEFEYVPTAVGVLGVLIIAAASLALLSELPRIGLYCKATFTPGVLVYGPAAKFKEVLGGGGIIAMQNRKAQPLGAGGVTGLFKRENPLPCPYEMVGLHIDLGNGPEIIPVEWEGVREFIRGEVVWFNRKAPLKFIFFHKLFPYCPNVRTDRETRNEVFNSLRVGGIEAHELPSRNNMGKTKVFEVNADGQIVRGQQQSIAKAEVAPDGLKTVGLGGHVDGELPIDSLNEPSIAPPPPEDRFGSADQGFDHFDQDFGNDDQQS